MYVVFYIYIKYNANNKYDGNVYTKCCVPSSDKCTIFTFFFVFIILISLLFENKKKAYLTLVRSRLPYLDRCKYFCLKF